MEFGLRMMGRPTLLTQCAQFNSSVTKLLPANYQQINIEFNLYSFHTRLTQILKLCFFGLRWKCEVQTFACFPSGETGTGWEICTHQLPFQNQWEKVPEVFIKTWWHQQIFLLRKLCTLMSIVSWLTYIVLSRSTWIMILCILVFFSLGSLRCRGIYQPGWCHIITWGGGHSQQQQPWSHGAFQITTSVSEATRLSRFHKPAASSTVRTTNYYSHQPTYTESLQRGECKWAWVFI